MLSTERALSAIGVDDSVMESIRSGLKDKDETVRAALVTALGHSEASTARELLVAALGDRSESVRVAAVEALGRTRDRHVELLVAALGDRSESVRLAAVEALV